MEGKSIEEMSGVQLTGNSTVPPGFRFHPTDEELVGYYLKKKVACSKIDLDVIREIDLYKIEPWDLQERCRIGTAEQQEWYFFSHKDKKYPTGTRTNRATTAGFWKATGRDKPIFTKVKLIGMRKTLVFYKGRAPNGQKSDWIMHEYRLEDDINNTATNEEGWVVCRVFKKRNMVKKMSNECCNYSSEVTPEKIYNNEAGIVKQEQESYYQIPYDPFTQLPRLIDSPKQSYEVSTTVNTPQASEGYINELEELVQMHSKNSPYFPTNYSEDPLWGSMGSVGIEENEKCFEEEFNKDTRRIYDVDLWGFNR